MKLIRFPSKSLNKEKLFIASLYLQQTTSVLLTVLGAWEFPRTRHMEWFQSNYTTQANREAALILGTAFHAASQFDCSKDL